MIWICAIAFVALQIVDWMLTGTILENGGREMNPAMRFVLRLGGIWGLLIAKLALAAAIIVTCAAYALPWLLAGLCAVYLGICAWNWRTLQRMR